MTRNYARPSYRMISSMDSSTQDVHKVENYDSDSDATDDTDVNTIYPFSPPLQSTAFLASNALQDTLETKTPTGKMAETKPRRSFRPELDVPRTRSTDTGFNRIRQIKNKDQLTGKKLKAGGESLSAKTRSSSEQKSNVIDDNSRPKHPKCESGSRGFKVEKSTLSTKKRIAHDRSLGPSMSKTAVDHRERKVIQEQYRQHLSTLLDADLVEEVEYEGGITPEGRVYKACVRMLERVQEQHQSRSILVSDIKIEENGIPTAEFEKMRQRAVKAEDKARRLQSGLEALLKSCD